jgi:hypothetical protein
MVKIGVEQASLAAGSVARKKITEQECPSNELFMAAMWKLDSACQVALIFS